MKLMILTKRSLAIIGACIIALVGGVCLISANANARVSASKRKLPIYCVETEKKQACLSFDAAWGNEDTQQLIDILEKYNVKATFFIVGQWVDKYPESVKALSDAGHDVMNHSDTHPNLPSMSRDGMLKEINNCNSKIEKITGVSPNLLRPPFGDYNNDLIETLKSQDMYCIQWDVDSLDWKDLSASEIEKRVISKTNPGSIILFHNAAKNTPEALPNIIETLQSDGYELVKINDLIYKDNYTIDHAGKQIRNQETVSEVTAESATIASE